MNRSVFPSMAELLTPNKSGEWSVEIFEVDENAAAFTRLTEMFSFGRNQAVPAGRYARLMCNGTVVMSDTPMERRTNIEVQRYSQGSVLIGGLGLGMITHAIAAKPEVTSITVIEKSPDVIRLINPSLPEKVSVVNGDIFEWKPEKGTQFDTLYFDIWDEICVDNLSEIAKLHQRFKFFKSPGGWMNSWQRDYLLYLRRQDRNRGWY